MFLLFFKSQEVAIYLLISCIKTWETFINSSYVFFYIGYDIFPSIALFISHKVTPHLVQVCFKFLQTTVFLLPFCLLRFIINWSQTFIKLYFVLLPNVHIAHEKCWTSFCTFFSFLLSSSFSGKSSRVDHQ